MSKSGKLKHHKSTGGHWPSLSELIGATALIAGRLAILGGEWREVGLVNWCGLLALWWACTYAARLVRSVIVWGRLPEHARGWPEWLGAACWLLVLFALLAVWPRGLSQKNEAILLWMWLVVLSGALVGSISAWLDVARARHVLRFAAFCWCLLCFLAASVYAGHVRKYVSGADFYYYVAYARDMLLDCDGYSLSCYSYFPGVFAFWRAMWRLTDGQLPSLQTIHVAVVGIAACAAAWTVGSNSGSPLLGMASGLLYWTIASRFEGFLGVVEPLASVPILLAYAYWRGYDPWAPTGCRRLAVLAIAWGLAVWMRQHAGFLALGWLALLAEWATRRERTYRQLLVLVMVPLLATAILAFGVLLEGRGLTPLYIAMQASGEYESRGHFIANIYHQVRNDESFAVLAVIALAASLALTLKKLFQSQPLTQQQRLVAVASVGSVAALYPFVMREYYHYSLLLVPGALLSQCSLWFYLRRYLSRSNGIWCLWLVMMFYLFMFHYTGGNTATFYYARLQQPGLVEWLPWHEQSAVANDLQTVRAHLEDADQRLYVIPPHRVEPFLVFELRASPAIGYGFEPPSVERFPWTEIRYVLVIEPRFDAASHRAERHRPSNQQLIDALPRRGFRPVLVLPTMSLYNRQ